MASRLKLSVLDQSVIRKGSTPAQAFRDTIETAKLAEQLGYTRFWVSEHHNSTLIAGSAPELLMVKLADETTSIRIGSGGIMLPNHSALKVAENFRLLETLFPGRIDLGMGRAPGGDRVTATLLNPSNTFSEESYIKQLEHLQAYFRDEANTLYGPLLAVPQAAGIPTQWILSSSNTGSNRIAAQLGLGLVIARFINGHVAPESVDLYLQQFQPSEQMQKPHVMLAISVICTDSEEKVKQLRKLADYNLLKFEKGRFEPIDDPALLTNHQFSEEELIRIQHNSGRIVSGTPGQVKLQLLKLAEDFKTDEIIVTTMTYSQEDRLRSFELLAKAFDLKGSR